MAVVAQTQSMSKPGSCLQLKLSKEEHMKKKQIHKLYCDRDHLNHQLGLCNYYYLVFFLSCLSSKPT